jgi:hypothetical protein
MMSLSRRLVRVAGGAALAVMGNWRRIIPGSDLAERPDKLPLQRQERHAERLGPREDYIIMAWPRRKRVE